MSGSPVYPPMADAIDNAQSEAMAPEATAPEAAFVDPFEDLPTELLWIVLASFRPPEVSRLREVCKKWMAAVDKCTEVQARISHCKKFCWSVEPGVWPIPFLGFAWRRDFGGMRARFDFTLPESGCDPEGAHRRSERRYLPDPDGRPVYYPLYYSLMATDFYFAATAARKQEICDCLIEWSCDLASIPEEKRNCCPRSRPS